MVRLALAIILLLAGPALAVTKPSSATKPSAATKPAAVMKPSSAIKPAATTKPSTVPVDPLLSAAQSAARSRKLAEFAPTVETTLRAHLDDLSNVKADVLIRLASLRQFSRAFGRIGEVDEGSTETLAWLVTQPRLFPALMTALSPADPPDRVLEVLRALRADHHEKLDEFADLAAAVCTVWDAPEHFGADEDAKIDPAEVSRIFGHFSKSANRLAFDPRKLPAELLAYVVDLKLVDDEITWAGRYGQRPDVSALFFAVPYNESVAYDRANKDVDEQAYLLPNLLRRGGGCVDEAYFATQIAKACGIPSAVCIGSNDGPIPAWAGFLQNGASGWNFSAARYRDHVGWAGEIVDPQTYTPRAECEVGILAGLTQTSVQDRWFSAALTQSADLVSVEKRIAVYKRAIDLSPANRAAWYALADFAAEQKLDDVAARPIEELMRKHLARQSPDFATVLRLRMLKGRGSIEFNAGLKRAANAVRDRPDLVAKIHLAAAERADQDRQPSQEIDAAMEVLKVGPPAGYALAALAHLDAVLRKKDDLERLNLAYRDVFSTLQKPSPSRFGRTTQYYRIGMKYADLLDEMKDPQSAGIVRTKAQNIALPNG